MLRGPAISFRDRFDFLDAHVNNGRRLERQSDSDTTSLSNKRDFGRGRCRRAKSNRDGNAWARALADVRPRCVQNGTPGDHGAPLSPRRIVRRHKDELSG